MALAGIDTIKEVVKLIEEVKNDEVRQILILYLSTICAKEGIVSTGKAPFKPDVYSKV